MMSSGTFGTCRRFRQCSASAAIIVHPCACGYTCQCYKRGLLAIDVERKASGSVMSASVDQIWSQLQKQRPGLKTADLSDIPGIKRTVRNLDQPLKPAAESEASSVSSKVTGDCSIHTSTSAPNKPADANTVSTEALQSDFTVSG